MKAEMSYQEALAIAEVIKATLAPHCERIEIAGSIRRQKEIIGDIEICAIPKPYDTGLFESGIATVVNQWEKVKGEMDFEKCKYTQRLLPNGITLDLFFAKQDKWGNIFLIRTGDWEFSKKFMGAKLPQMGYKQEDGYLKYNGKIIPCPEEIDLFNRAGIKFIEPKNRNVNSL